MTISIASIFGTIFFLVTLLCLMATIRMPREEKLKIPENRFWKQFVFTLLCAFVSFNYNERLVAFIWFLSSLNVLVIMQIIHKTKYPRNKTPAE